MSWIIFALRHLHCEPYKLSVNISHTASMCILTNLNVLLCWDIFICSRNMPEEELYELHDLGRPSLYCVTVEMVLILTSSFVLCNAR